MKERYIMVCHIAILDILHSKEKSKGSTAPIWYLDKLDKKDNGYTGGPFEEYSGGLVIYQAKNYEEALNIAENGLHAKEKSKRLELNEWSTYVYSSLFNQPL